MPCDKKVVFSDDFKKILLNSNGQLPINTEDEATWVSLDKIDYFEKNDGSLVCQQLAKSWEFMPNSQAPFKIKIPEDHEIIFFGGSFNPWHKGHESCLKLLNKPLNTFIVPDNNPRKEVQSSECSWKRYQDLKKKIPFQYPIYPGFWSSSSPNPTSSWLPQIKKTLPKVRLSLLMGFDSFLTIHEWIDAQKLLESLSKIYVASRLDNKELRDKQSQYLKSHYQIELIFLGHHEYEDISSTKLRAQNIHNAQNKDS